MSRGKVFALAGAMAVTLAVLENSAETLLALSLFYLAPLALGTWYISAGTGALFAAFAAGAFLVRTLSLEMPPAIAVGNCSIRLGVFLIFVWLIDTLHRHTRRQSAAVHDRTAKLLSEMDERRRKEREFFDLLQQQREQIAYNLHDGLAQFLTAIAMKTKHLERELSTTFSPHAESAESLVKLMNEAVGQTRDIARGLSPIDVDGSDLVAAIRRLANESAEIFGIDCRSASTQSHLPYNHESSVHIYRIAQQAIDNAIRHGKAARVRVRLGEADGTFRLLVEDNGTGFDENQVSNRGLGLRTMAFRADAIGGTLSIRSRVGQGTSIEVLARVDELRRESHADAGVRR